MIIFIFVYSIYLVDHAWTFRNDTARQQLENYTGLVERMAALLDMDTEEEGVSKAELVEKVLEAKWRLAQTYSVGNAELSVEDRMPVWYLMDEFGARIQHSDSPNFRLVPFYSMLDNCAYCLLFPIK